MMLSWFLVLSLYAFDLDDEILTVWNVNSKGQTHASNRLFDAIGEKPDQPVLIAKHELRDGYYSVKDASVPDSDYSNDDRIRSSNSLYESAILLLVGVSMLWLAKRMRKIKKRPKFSKQPNTVHGFGSFRIS
jgi:hypothetical protein